MASTNEDIVREYFEALGFLTRMPRKYQVAARSRMTLQEEVDLIVVNPDAAEAPIPGMGVWGPEELSRVQRAVVGVRGWHTERFSPAVRDRSPEVYRFASDEVVDDLRDDLGQGDVARILCVSDLPASKSLLAESLDALAGEGIHGVLLFAHMLRELVQQVDVNRNYEKSNLLQLLRLMKNYDLVKDPQLELFVKRRKR